MGCTEITVEEAEITDHVEVTSFNVESVEGTTEIFSDLVFKNYDNTNSHTANIGIKLIKVNDDDVSVPSLWFENDVSFSPGEVKTYNDILIDIADHYPDILLGDKIVLEALCVDNYDGHFTDIEKTITLGKKTETDYMKYVIIGGGILIALLSMSKK